MLEPGAAADVIVMDYKPFTPFGPAAGPHTQLAQNIIAAYAEYVKAWWACKLLARELGLGDPDGFVFNMSVGYDLVGIQSPKVDAYIEGMKDASDSEVWRECLDWALGNLGRFEKVDEGYVKAVSPRVSASITESTLHGCPPDEIERIANYLIRSKGLNTYVKCNPTLLGYEFARKTLDGLGYDYIVFDDHHFTEDLQWADAIPADPHWRKPVKPIPSRKTGKRVPLMDCFQAPCREGCPIHQDTTTAYAWPPPRPPGPSTAWWSRTPPGRATRRSPPGSCRATAPCPANPLSSSARSV